MKEPIVLLASARDLPPGRAWLGPAEQGTLARFRAPRRRRDFRLGRFAARRALAILEESDAEDAASRFEVRAAAGGGPLVFRDGRACEVALSISHSDGWAAAGVQRGRTRLGCDLERVEVRSSAFIADHFTPAEREFVFAGRSGDPGFRATLVWSAKEAVTKALGQGLRRALAEVTVVPTFERSPGGGWRTFSVAAPAEGADLRGFWRVLGRFVLTVAADLGEPNLIRSPNLDSFS